MYWESESLTPGLTFYWASTSVPDGQTVAYSVNTTSPLGSYFKLSFEHNRVASFWGILQGNLYAFKWF